MKYGNRSDPGCRASSGWRASTPANPQRASAPAPLAIGNIGTGNISTLATFPSSRARRHPGKGCASHKPFTHHARPSRVFAERLATCEAFAHRWCAHRTRTAKLLRTSHGHAVCHSMNVAPSPGPNGARPRRVPLAIGNIFTTRQKLFRAQPCAAPSDLINYCHQPARFGLSGAELQPSGWGSCTL